MKRITLYIIGATLAVLAVLSVSYLMEWSFWKLAFISLASCGIFKLRSKHPRTAKWSMALIFLVIALNWGWSWFRDNFPFAYSALPYGQNRQDVGLARDIDPGLSKARTVLVLELRKKEDALAEKIPNLMQANKYAEMGTNVQEVIDLRKQIDKLLAQTAPPPPRSPKAVSTASTRPMLPGVTLEISLTNGQVYAVSDLRQGQSWRYLSFDGAFSHRIDKGNNQACWKKVENNLPYWADCAGKLELRAGNTPVKLTVNIP